MRAACQPTWFETPDVARPTGLDRPDQRAHRLLDGGVLVPGVREPHVDVAGAQPLQRGVELVHQGPARAVDDPAAAGPADARLGDEHDLVAVGALEEVAEQVLGGATGVPVRGVDEGAAGRAEGREQVPGVLGGGAGAPRHRPEAEPRDGQAGGAEAAGEHGGDPIARPLATVGAMRLAISCGYAGMGLGNDTLDLVREAERLGYAQAWVAEAYGSDAPTVLGVARRRRPRRSGSVPASCRSRRAPRR